MLETLTIHNYAIIDEMSTAFSRGLNIITGETGAGKSIVVDALELVLGARASAEMIRAGSSGLVVSGVFTGVTLSGPNLPDIDTIDDMLILRREVRADGKNRCYINDSPVTLRTLKEIGDRLVDFHGQHDHQSLLSAIDHVEYLDGFAGLGTLADRVAKEYEQMRSIRHDIRKIEKEIESTKRDRDLFTFQLEEIDRVAIQPGEDDELEVSISRLSSASDLKAMGLKTFQRLSEAEGSVAETLNTISRELESATSHDPSLAPMSDRLGEILDSVEDTAHFFRTYAENLDDDPALLDELDERLAMIERLKKKYGPSLDDLFAYREKIAAALEGSEMSREKLDSLRGELKSIENSLFESSSELSRKRKEAAPGLSAEVEHHLADLGMSGARLVAAIDPCTGPDSLVCGDSTVFVSEKGLDSVEFLIAANPGEPPKSLVKVASGGEISRIMLALKLTLSDISDVPSMVFDEIDVGVSGRIAEAIGRKLKTLTAKRQALVITHLPQIAAMAERHFSARKKVDGDRTSTGLILLDDSERQRELASLLSGDTLTDAALAHAQEMIESQKDGNEDG